MSTTRVLELAGIKISESTKYVPDEDAQLNSLAENINSLFDAVDTYEYAAVLEQLVQRSSVDGDGQAINEGFWNNLKDSAKGALGVASAAKNDAKAAVGSAAEKIKAKAASVAGDVKDVYNANKEQATKSRQAQTVKKMDQMIIKDIKTYIGKLLKMVNDEFDGKAPQSIAVAIDMLSKIISNKKSTD